MEKPWEKKSVGNERKQLSDEDKLSPIFVHDCYETPPWAVRAFLLREPEFVAMHDVLDPCCGQGVIANELDAARCAARRPPVHRADIRAIDGVAQRDFLTTAYTDLDAVIMNPPFKLTPQFVSHALDCVRDGGLVALFQRTQLLEGSDRYKKMWASEQLADFYEHTARVNCYPEGRVDHRHSGMMTFAWFVLRKGHRGPFRGQWIPDRQQDYGVGALLPQQVGMCWWCRLYRESACCSPSPAPKQLTNAMIARLREITDAHELDDRGAHGYNLESLCGSWRARQ